MVTNDLGACEWFVWDLRRSALIDRGQLDQIVSEFLKRNPRADAPQLAEYLVAQGTLTAFQAERILNQKTQGLVLGPYVLLDAIGQGSMGQVFRASSKNDNNQYAVKVLPRRSMWNVRLARRQVRSFSQFSHPAVVPFVDVGTAGGLHYLAWPMIEGQTLETLVGQEGRLPSDQSARIGVQVAQGMHAAHHNNIFHGLIKPSNIMVGTDGQARILDYGIGSLLVENEGESLVDTMSTANTLTSGLDCSSPESVMDPTIRTPQGDQYSFGCVMYYCLTGHVPFPDGNAVEKMMAHQSKKPQAISEFAPNCPEGLIQVVDRLMAKKPEDRFSGMDEVVEALEPYLGDLANTETPQPQASAATMGSAAKNKGISNFGNAPSPVAKPAPSRVIAPPPAPAMPQHHSTPARSTSGISHAGSAHRSSTSSFGTGPKPVHTKISLPPKPTAPVGRSAPPTKPAAPAGRGAVPGRGTFHKPQEVEEEIPLTSSDESQDYEAKSDSPRVSANWISGMPQERKKPAFGAVGMIAAALILAVLVFMGTKLLLQQ